MTSMLDFACICVCHVRQNTLLKVIRGSLLRMLKILIRRYLNLLTLLAVNLTIVVVNSLKLANCWERPDFQFAISNTWCATFKYNLKTPEFIVYFSWNRWAPFKWSQSRVQCNEMSEERSTCDDDWTVLRLGGCGATQSGCSGEFHRWTWTAWRRWISTQNGKRTIWTFTKRYIMCCMFRCKSYWFPQTL